MKRRFQNLPLNKKLAVIILMTTVAAMLLSAVAIVSYQVHSFTRFILTELDSTAKLASVRTTPQWSPHGA